MLGTPSKLVHSPQKPPSFLFHTVSQNPKILNTNSSTTLAASRTFGGYASAKHDPPYPLYCNSTRTFGATLGSLWRLPPQSLSNMNRRNDDDILRYIFAGT
ncbi:hypothetical protein PM082_011468 [Marasmius tenuissimus]|nr:hypothetical protein PM082_011468 [Marasmius tenuissimus]